MNHLYLIADDDESTRVLIKRAFLKAGLDYPLQFVADGCETLEYLRGGGRYANREEFPFPSILLIDHNMPRMNGLETVRAIRADPALAALIVVMHSSSIDESQILEAYRAGVNSYIEKAGDFSELVHNVACINHYWFGCNHFPHALNGVVRPVRRKASGSDLIWSA